MEYIINAPVTAASAGPVYGVITIESPELAGAASPGQFLHIRCEGYQLRRPISIAGVAGDRLTVIYEIKGKGTRWLSQRKAGDVLAVLGPLGHERVGDVSNVVFTNGAIADDDGKIYLYYASSDTRMHVAETDTERLCDYVFNTPADPLRSADCVRQRAELIRRNLEYLRSK